MIPNLPVACTCVSQTVHTHGAATHPTGPVGGPVTVVSVAVGTTVHLISSRISFAKRASPGGTTNRSKRACNWYQWWRGQSVRRARRIRFNGEDAGFRDGVHSAQVSGSRSRTTCMPVNSMVMSPVRTSVVSCCAEEDGGDVLGGDGASR